MKKILATLFFLGITTTGFSQLLETKEYSGRALVSRTSNTIEVTCQPAERICFTLTRVSYDHGLVRLRIPDFLIDEIVAPASTINGQPIEDLPNVPEDNSVERHYIIELQPIED